MNCIVIGMDFQDTLSPLLEAARRFAPTHTWILLHVEPPEPDFVTYEPGPQYVRDDVAQTIHDRHARLAELADTLRAEGIAVQSLVVQGEAGTKLLEKAAHFGADAILLGNRRHGALHDLLLGSVTRDVLRRAACPVFLVPTPPDGSA